MAEGAGGGPLLGLSFFSLGEIRIARDSDYEYFIRLAENHEGWTKKLDKNGLYVWNRPTGNTSIKMFKVFGELKDVPASVVFDTLKDAHYRKNWDEAMLEDYDVCMLDGNNVIGYYAMKSPNPLKNRDLVNQRSWRVKPDEEYILFNHSVPHEDLPPKKGFIRAMSYLTGFVIRSKGPGCTITYVTQSDARGAVPKWLMNFGVDKLVPSMFSKIAQAARKYPEWKAQNQPDHKPWLFPEQLTLPLVDQSILQRQAQEHEDLLTSQEEQPEVLEEGEPPPGFDLGESEAVSSLSLSLS